MRRHIIALTAPLILLSGFAAADDATKLSDNAKYRMIVMSALGDHVGGFALIFMGKVKQPGHLQAHADGIAAMTAEIADLVPAGSEGGDALPLIWQESDKFAQLAKDAAEAGAAIQAAAASGDRGATSKAFKRLGETCKGCHDKYREDDKDGAAQH